jgi:hypothetical protein
MKRIFFAFAFLFVCVSYAFSQDYKTGIGLRGGWTSGLTVKTFLKESKALEFILSNGWRYRGWQITGLYEVHKPAFAKDDVEGLFWLYGAGLHFGGGYSWSHWHGGVNGYWHEHHYSAFGIDGILGIEYKIPDIPFTVGADIKPFLDFVTDRDNPYGFGFWDGALSIRFVF